MIASLYDSSYEKSSLGSTTSHPSRLFVASLNRGVIDGNAIERTPARRCECYSRQDEKTNTAYSYDSRHEALPLREQSGSRTLTGQYKTYLAFVNPEQPDAHYNDERSQAEKYDER